MSASNPIKSTSALRCVECYTTQRYAKQATYLFGIWFDMRALVMQYVDFSNKTSIRCSDPMLQTTFRQNCKSMLPKEKENNAMPPPRHVTNQIRELIRVKINSANNSQNPNHKTMQVRQILPFSKKGNKGLRT